MGFQCGQIRGLVSKGVAPFYGLSSSTVLTSALITGFPGRGTPGTQECTFSLNAMSGKGEYMYFAYPASYGTALFCDTDSAFWGGWDGANDDPQNVFGPALLNVTYRGATIPFYVYRTDYPELGVCNWQVAAAVHG